ncbi:hypothetical protein ABZ570_16645 [Micromonospora sp. NPDC007271]|uniref:hypothetical protein n=1 Tax=Micromonospora sp. NPDC007271 TaxID=3154587 RepID=UPI0033DF805B
MSAVPYVVLAWPIRSAAPRFGPSACQLWAEAEEGLAALRDTLATTGDGERVSKGFLHATERLGSLSRRLQAVAGVADVAALPPPVRVHSDYFRIRHAELTPEQHAAQVAAVLHRTVADLRFGMLDINDVRAELAGALLILAALRPAPTATDDRPRMEPEWFDPDGDWMDRWLLVHHCYFLFNLHAAAELDRAARAVRDEPAVAVEALNRAAVLVHAFTAAMLHSAAMPSEYYEEMVRPTMAPPRVAINLTGAMQPEHRIYRSALRRLLAVLDAPYPDLASANPALAAARDGLLGADLLDLERHVSVAAVLVGSGQSLMQRSAAGNAIGTLREMRHIRALAYRDLLEFGECWLT